MKKQFSKSWKGSSQARKQRKYLANAPRNILGKMLSSHLSKELREKYNRRSFQLRKGDTVKVMSGESKGKTGKVSMIDAENSRAAIEGVQLTKKEGSKVNLYFKASKLMIIELNLEDKKRIDSIKKEEVKTEKTQKKEAKK